MTRRLGRRRLGLDLLLHATITTIAGTTALASDTTALLQHLSLQSLPRKRLPPVRPQRERLQRGERVVGLYAAVLEQQNRAHKLRGPRGAEPAPNLQVVERLQPHGNVVLHDLAAPVKAAQRMNRHHSRRRVVSCGC